MEYVKSRERINRKWGKLRQIQLEQYTYRRREKYRHGTIRHNFRSLKESFFDFFFWNNILHCVKIRILLKNSQLFFGPNFELERSNCMVASVNTAHPQVFSVCYPKYPLCSLANQNLFCTFLVRNSCFLLIECVALSSLQLCWV
jgi:hypothetical protein